MFVYFAMNFNYPKHIFKCSGQGVTLMVFWTSVHRGPECVFGHTYCLWVS